jgi:hypothetical protein
MKMPGTTMLANHKTTFIAIRFLTRGGIELKKEDLELFILKS